MTAVTGVFPGLLRFLLSPKTQTMTSNGQCFTLKMPEHCQPSIQIGRFYPVDARFPGGGWFSGMVTGTPTFPWARARAPSKNAPVGPPGACVPLSPTGPTVHATDADIAAWWRLFNFCDEDRSGAISRAEIGSRMSPMVGQFEWDDDNADGLMEFAEFVQCVYALPVSKRHTCLRWAQGYCPDKTRGRPPPAVQQRRASGPFRGDPSALPARVRDPGADAEDRRAWARLHRFIDADGSGAIGRREIEAKMAPMVGAFEWEDGDADGEMDFEEFVRCMTALPANKRHTCLLWAKMQCPA